MWRPDRLLKLLLIYLGLILLFVWLPLLRGAMDGPSYSWGFGPGIGGRGTGGWYWVLPPLAVVGLATLYLGWRGARRPFHWLLLGWLGALASTSILSFAENPDGIRIEGETLGISVSLGWGPVVFDVAVLVLALTWVVRDLRRGSRALHPPWTRANRNLLLAAVVLLPIQLALLRSGEPSDTTDQIGVVLVMVQWLLVNLSFYPWKVRA